ncbi:restriction endonuclease subunit S [Rhodopirellula sp. P2]|uniref:restriction endonuclease subunit S n=1 Tax=Rhodopirellula sp. P2 TaxID=2127060 RepID=UPI00236772A4|nr:restriction endonuclease subunit S [Rhodopirellula sp. P2]WDQ15717.1 restriction endonuclease subunit S [Rhodopirellula sp. P2]
MNLGSALFQAIGSFLPCDTSLILVAEDGANLLSRSTPLAFIATGKYWVNNHAHILRPIEGDLKFFECLLQIYDYTPIVTGAAHPKLTAEQLAGIRLPNPPLDEQKAISSFLDVETSKIDGLVSEQRRLIELLICRKSL